MPLLIKNITNIVIHSDEWYQGRLAKFTSSEIYNLMGKTPFTEGALNYIRRKVGEELTGIPCRDEVTTKATEWGHTYEPEAIRLYMQRNNLEFVVQQKLITIQETRFGSTPDFLQIVSQNSDGLSYNVITNEVKCPISYDSYVELALCKTPEDVKKVSKPYYFQVIDQMDVCGALQGNLIVYNPLFKVGMMNVINFRKLLLTNEFKLLKERKALAVEKFEEIRNELLNLK